MRTGRTLAPVVTSPKGKLTRQISPRRGFTVVVATGLSAVPAVPDRLGDCLIELGILAVLRGYLVEV